MKKIFISVGAIFLAGFSQAQLTNTENYVYLKTYLDYNGTTPSKTSETIQYFDGLGRPKQIVNVKASPQQKDVVTHIEYDGFGRQIKDFLPVPQSNTLNGGIVIDPLANATQPGIYGSEKIYAQKVLENSPLDRIQQQIQVGNDWSNKPVKLDYDANSVNDYVGNFVTTTTWLENATKTKVRAGNNLFYATAQLYKNTVTDEDGNKTIEFKNGQGQTVLVRKVLNATENADTYYVYNEYNQLALVIPPKASFNFYNEYGAGSDDEIPDDILNNLCYQYRYDGRNRLVEKKLPGKSSEFMVYDKADRLIATQDANLRPDSKWIVTKYDKFGRVIYTGIMPLPGQTRGGLQTITNNYVITENRSSQGFTMSGMQVYYTNDLYSQIETILSVNYYDTYPIGTPGFTATLPGNAFITDNFTQNVNTKSLPVASFVKNIEDDNWTKNFTWYDNKGRAIASHSINHLEGYTKTESELDFSGTPKQVVTRHKRLDSDTERVIRESFTYDHQNRLLTHKHKVDNNAEEILTQNEYNELSQLKTKKVGGTIPGSGLQWIDYKYNIRGWMTQINDPADLGTDLFGYKINYNQVEGLSMPHSDFPSLLVKPKYNGNIAEISWKTLTEENEPLKRYGYVYDNLNRLNAGFYQKAGAENAQEYYERLEYDLNGNITRLQRSEGLAPGSNTAMRIDNLKYDYMGNRLTKVTEEQVGNSNGYPYLASHNTIEYDNNLSDGNGNMTKHLDKGINAIIYNYLNLPSQIARGSGRRTNISSYTYRADGTKLKKTISTGNVFSNSETDYLDGFQYDNKNGFSVLTPVLKFVPTSEGYFDFEKNQYIYNYVDHLGNVRIGYSDSNGDNFIQPRDLNVQHCEDMGDGNIACYSDWVPGEVVEVNNYYPFGLLHNYTATTTNSYQYKYQGQELQETGFYSFKWRNYMPDVGRFLNIDPLAEEYPTWAPYVFSGNRVIDARELEGLEPVIINNSNGNMEVNYYTKVIPKEGMTEQQVNTHLSEVSGILSQNEGLKINMIHSETATFGIDMTKTYQGYRISTNEKGEQVFTFVQGNAYQGNPVSQTINSGGEVRTTAHEIAHGLGLPHIFTGVPAVVPNTPENKDNLLNSDANSAKGMTPATGTKLLQAQTDVMKKVIELVQPVKTNNNDKPQQ